MNQMLERSRAIPKSALHAIHRVVEAQDDDIIALHIGEAHLKIPNVVKEAFVRAISDGHSTYCDAPGLVELRAALCEHVSKKTGAVPAIEHMFVTPGSCQGISAILLSLAYEGGGILLPEVHWPMHLQQVMMAGLRPKFYSMDNLDLSVTEVLDQQYDKDVCAILVNSPSNPAGKILTELQIREIYEWAQQRGVWVISDEAYEDFAFDGAHTVMGSLDAVQSEADRIVFGVRTFSKTYSMTGYRLGYVSAPNNERAQLLLKVQEASLVAPCLPVQFAGLAALADETHVQAHHKYVKETRDIVLDMLEEHKLIWTRPEGGWYALIDLSAYTNDADELCMQILEEAKVAFAPGRSFARNGHKAAPTLARLAFCRERDYTIKGVQQLLNYLDTLRRVN